ncbi:hypothetical protein CTI12_AA621020 [Artemisia annua]|uniref:Uncharacterized protein n=1 Tax=Artemisia annua TaxID=35608 RepID=A0A2U1KBX4_ARTAN|nr:hypothetical protein CTI12_AA621020 [Artemisia annua]
MERKTITVCIIVVVLGVAAAIAGFAAESTKVKVKHIATNNDVPMITSFVAIVLFLQGARLSSMRGAERGIDGEYHCYTVRPGIFSGAGIMGLVSVLLAIVYYINYASAKHGAAKTSEVDLELEAPSTMDGKKPPITDAMKPPITDAMKPPVPMQKH